MQYPVPFRPLAATLVAAFFAFALTAQKGAGGKKAEKKPVAPVASEPAVEYEEVWLKVGVVFNYPSGSAPAVVFPTDKRFLPTPKTPLRIRGAKNGKVAVLVDGQPLHTQYKVKPRKGTAWSYKPEKGDFVERMIRRPKPVQPEPQIVETVDKSEKDELADEWNGADVETVKDNQVIATQVQETNAKSEEYRKPFHERLFGVAATYTNNYTEHYAQYFTLPSSALLFKADIGNYSIGRFFFEYLASQNPGDLPAGSTYKNPNFWKLGYRGRYFGAHFKSQTTPNPAGLMVRDRTSSEFGVDGRYSFDIAGFMWMSLGSNLLFLYYDKPTSSGSTMLQLGMLLNLTADLSTTVLRQGGLYDIIAHAGTAFSLLDSTNSGYDTAGTWNTNNRSMALSGFRLGLTGHFYVVDTVRLTASAFLYTLMSSGYQRFTNTNRDTAASMFILNFGAEFRM